MNSSSRVIRPLLIVVLLLFVNVLSFTQFANFVTRKGDKLFDGENQLRFISFNIPNLHYLEDYLPFEGTNPWRLPDEFEIRDALKSIKQLGGKVTRMYVLSVRREGDPPDILRHVEGPGQFNEEAFRTIDKVLQIANEVGVRVMIPFVDNWHWWGGPKEYAGFRGKERDAFWIDPEVIADLKATIKFVITRKNTYTGVMYRDDKAILTWETGNEMVAPFSWTKEIAAYVKSLDPHHLLADGTNIRTLSEDAIADPNLDIVTTHHYGDPGASLDFIVKNQALARGRKPYLVGEFGIVPLQDLRAIVDTIINQGLVGGMIWSLRVHNREGGFYCHYEYNNVEAYRWPGFANGDVYNERMVLTFLRDKAYLIDGMLAPRLPIPDAPLLLPVTDPARISWQGSAGAQSYRIERRENPDSSWRVVAESADDSRAQYRPLYHDDSAEPGKEYFYRIRAVNESGSSGVSNVAGPVNTNVKTFVDELEDFAHIFQKDGELRLLTIEDVRKAKEDRSRLSGDDGSYVVYELPAAVSGVRVEWLRTGPESAIELSASADLHHFAVAHPLERVFRVGKNDYGFYDAVASTADSLPAGTRYVKIALHGAPQIGRVEVTFGRIGRE